MGAAPGGCLEAETELQQEAVGKAEAPEAKSEEHSADWPEVN